MKSWSYGGLFMMVLVLSMPFYSANVLAVSVQVTKNQGEDGLQGYLDANSDVWTVEAKVVDALDVTAENLVIQVGSNSRSFDSCASSALGVTCSYVSPLQDGISEGKYEFKVLYTPINGAVVSSVPHVITADGSAPTINVVKIKQNSAGDVEQEFTVSDKSGLKSVEVINADSGEVVKTYDVSGPEFVAPGILGNTFTGDSIRRLQVRASDVLGHVALSSVISVPVDKLAPVVGSVNLTGFGKFVGPNPERTDVEVYITERNGPLEVTAVSQQAEVAGLQASCSHVKEELWKCLWPTVRVAGSTVELAVSVKDGKGNFVTSTVSPAELVADVTPPEILHFGSNVTYNEVSFVKSGTNKLVLVVRDVGSGVDVSQVIANLADVGGSASAVPSCQENEGIMTCTWQISASKGGRIDVKNLRDKVGNNAILPDIEVVYDDVAPVVKELELFGLSDIGLNTFFRSKDKLQLHLVVDESNGFVLDVDVSDVVNDPASEVIRLTQEGCVRVGSNWDCSYDLPEIIRDGPVTQAVLGVFVQDTAGNSGSIESIAANLRSVSKGVAFEILGIEGDLAPDYWEVRKANIRPLVEFVDLDTVALMSTRIPYSVRLTSDNSRVSMLRLDAEKCVSDDERAPEVGRVLFHGGTFIGGRQSPVNTNLVLEFDPIEDARTRFGVAQGFEETIIDYTCKFRVFTKLGRNALQAQEIQEIIVPVSFAYSTLGAIDENLAEKYAEVEDSWLTDLGDVTGFMNDLFQWLRYLSNMLSIIKTVSDVIDLFTGSMVVTASVFEKDPATGVLTFGTGKALAASLRGQCLVLDESKKPFLEFTEYLQIPAQILSCDPSFIYRGSEKEGAIRSGQIDFSEGSGITKWYGYWQTSVLNTYNAVSLRDLAGQPATSLYDNIYTSAAGLCLPGIVYNLNKLSEVQCRRLICYAKEVPAGVATIAACDDLFDLQVCELFAGPAIDWVGFGLTNVLGGFLQNIYRSIPLGGLIGLVDTIGCGILCFNPDSGAALTTCRVTRFTTKMLDIVNSVAGVIASPPSVTSTPYCDQVDDLDIKSLVSAKGSVSEQVVVEEAPVEVIQ